MPAFLAVLRYDASQLARSWLVRIWIGLLVIPAVFLVIVAANEGELASETLAFYVAAIYAPISAIAVSLLSAGTVSGEAAIISDSILSRSITRTEYISAKIIARISLTMGIYVVVVVPFAYLVVRYASTDTSTPGIAIGLVMVGSLLAFLASAGITLSTVSTNILVGVLILLFGVVSSGVVLQFIGLTWMSYTAVLNELPTTFRGETPVWEQVRVLSAFTLLNGAATFGTLWLFRRKDL